MKLKLKPFVIRSLYMTCVAVLFALLFKFEGIRDLVFFYWRPGEDIGISLEAFFRMFIYIVTLFVLMLILKVPMRIMLSYCLLSKNKYLSFKDSINTSFKFRKNRSKGDSNFITTMGEIIVLILSIIIDTFNWLVSVLVSIGSTMIAAMFGASTTLVAGSFAMIILAIIPIVLMFGAFFVILWLTWSLAPFFIPFLVLGLVNKITNSLIYQMFEIDENDFSNKDDFMLNANRKSKIIAFAILLIPLMMTTGLIAIVDKFDSATLSTLLTMAYAGGFTLLYSIFSIPFVSWEYKIYNRIIEREKHNIPTVIEAEVREIK